MQRQGLEVGRKLLGFLVHAHCCFRIAEDCAQVGVWLGKPRPAFLHTHQVNSSVVMEAQGSSLRPPAAPPDPYPAPGLSQCWSLVVCSAPTQPQSRVTTQPALTWRAGRRLCWLGMTFIETMPWVSF